jgi:uncharacterized membrane protein YphA (DoxX/SURF4 family)
MTTTLWILQGILAFIFLMAGTMKLIKSPDDLIEMGMDYAEDMSASSVKIVGLLEVLAAVGLILPVALNILPMLTGWAGVGVVLTMLGAILVHVRRGEMPQIAVNIIIGAMGAFVAYSHLA